jgi:ubiquinone/menaquinone biosynthesis C-methylase UbiE
LRIVSGTRVADVAAGTGKFTELLVPTGASVIAIEPLEEMRGLLAASLPSVPVVAGIAERIPLRDASLDALTVAQAFHWFDAAAALDEFGRVLHPGGGVALVWYGVDRTEDWVDETWSVIDRIEPKAPWRDFEQATATWDQSFLDCPWFTPLTIARFRYEQLLSRDDLVERVRSVSMVAALGDDAQRAALDEVRAVLDRYAERAGGGEFALPYRVATYWAERV